MEIELTKFADKTLCEIYSAYLNRRASGNSIAEAANFGNRDSLSDPDWFTADGEAAVNELSRAGMLELNIIGGFTLKEKAIIYMENRSKRKQQNFLEEPQR